MSRTPAPGSTMQRLRRLAGRAHGPARLVNQAQPGHRRPRRGGAGTEPPHVPAGSGRGLAARARRACGSPGSSAGSGSPPPCPPAPRAPGASARPRSAPRSATTVVNRSSQGTTGTVTRRPQRLHEGHAPSRPGARACRRACAGRPDHDLARRRARARARPIACEVLARAHPRGAWGGRWRGSPSRRRARRRSRVAHVEARGIPRVYAASR